MKSLQIRDAAGKVVSRSRNLRGVRAYAGKHNCRNVFLSRMANGGGRLRLQFQDGETFLVEFASFRVLCRTVAAWRNIYGARLYIQHIPRGRVSAKNSALIRGGQPV
jgi:hypothetical protein